MAINDQREWLARPCLDSGYEILPAADRLSAGSDDEVTRLQAGLGAGTVGQDLLQPRLHLHHRLERREQLEARGIRPGNVDGYRGRVVELDDVRARRMRLMADAGRPNPPRPAR